VAGGEGLMTGEEQDVVAGRHYTDLVALSPATFRFTVKDYHRMAEADIFRPKQRVELLDGEVLEMSPIGPRHAACVNRLAFLFMSQLGETGMVRVQHPIELDPYSEPEPDLALVTWQADFYESHHPEPSDTLLLVEVADTSLRYDLERKVPLYIAGGVPDVWVIDLVTDTLHVARGGQTMELHAGDSVAPLAFPDVVLDVAVILG
jgi:Uma2 family endonuclease